jgi:hypothetical protein
MPKKKRKIASKTKIRTPNHADSEQSVDDFRPDPLVEGDSILFDTKRIFTVGQQTIQYTFREYFTYFPWENKKSKFYSQKCPPASYHLEKRSDLKSFDFFSFIKDSKKIRMYKFARENALCDDLLEYISDNIEAQSIVLFRQKLEELRDSRLLITTSKTELETIDPPIRSTGPIISDCHFLKIREFPKEESIKATSYLDPKLNEFLNWFNKLDDPLVTEVTLSEPLSEITMEHFIYPSHDDEFTLEALQTTTNMLRFGSVEDIGCIRKLVQSLINKYFRKYNTKFKFVLGSSPGSGKTYMKHLFSGYKITDLDDISMNDPIEGRKFQSLVNKREWNSQKIEYHRVIRSKFKEGVLLAQNSNQVPKEIPYINIVTPGHIGEKKLWSDRGLYDLVIKNKFKVFVDNLQFRNKLFQIVYEELFNSFNYM